jgi:hypothetical protein
MARTPGTQIVVGVDGSAAAETAVRWAVREARLRHAAVRLVCAFHTDTRLRAPYAPWAWAREDETRAAAQASLDRAAHLVRAALPPGWLIAELVDEPPRPRARCRRPRPAPRCWSWERAGLPSSRGSRRWPWARWHGSACAARPAPSSWSPPATWRVTRTRGQRRGAWPCPAGIPRHPAGSPYHRGNAAGRSGSRSARSPGISSLA